MPYQIVRAGLIDRSTQSRTWYEVFAVCKSANGLQSFVEADEDAVVGINRLVASIQAYYAA